MGGSDLGDIITVVSGKGGVGKSTVAASVARHLKQWAKRVLLVDTDGGICSAQLLVSGGESAIYHLGDLFAGVASVEETTVVIEGEPHFLAAPDRLFTPREWRELALLLLSLRERYDYIVVDRAAGLDFVLEQYLTDYTALVVSTPDPLSLRGAGQACHVLRQMGCENVRLVINRFLPAYVRQKIMPNIDSICDRVGAQLIGIVPEDLFVLQDLTKGKPTKEAPYNKALNRIAGRLAGNAIALPKLKKLLK